MAYDQGYYKPQQRPYNGPAAQRPRPPPQDYQQSPPQQQYHQQNNEQYSQDGYYDGYDQSGYDQRYDQGYTQDYSGRDGYNGRGGYQDMNGGGRGNEYAQQEYYPDARGGGAMPSPNRGGRGPSMRPPTADSVLGGGYDQRGGERGYPNGGPQPQPHPHMGRGGRPPLMDRNVSSDPGMKAQVRRPLMSAPELPDVPTWDNPFPAFPGTKKKASREVERTVVENMAAMDIRAPPPSQSMSKRADGGRGSQDRYPGRRSADDYGRPSVDSQRNIPPRGPIQGQGYPDPRRGPPGPAPRPTYDPPRQDGHANPAYDDRGAYGPPAPVDGFGPPSRSMTMPNQPPMGMQAPRQAPPPVDPSASERPYNGPIGKGMPPRPSTTTGVRPPPQRIYPNQNPAPPPVQAVKPPQLQYPPKDSYANQNNNHLAPQSSESQQRESVSDFYDSYYNSAEPQNPRHTRSQSNGSEIPNLDLIASNTVAHRRAGSMEGHRQPGIVARGNSWEQQLPNGQQNGQTNGFHGQMKPIQLQPDFSNRAQPQAAIFEMVGESPSANGYQQGYQDDRYVPQGDQYKGQQPSNQQGYGGYQAPQAQNGFQQLPRSTSAAPRSNASAGLPMGPKSGFVGLPSGPSPQQGGMAPRTTPEALPSHPPPVRAGLIPNSVVNLANNKPTPVRNYNNSGPVSTPQTSVSSTPAAESKPAGLPPVTLEELERLRTVIKNNPNDQATQLILAKRLVEASIDLVAKLPDQRQRNKARERYIMDAHKVLKKLVAVQNPEAMFYLADCHGRGALGLEADNKEAFSLYQSAAKAGHAAAAYRTAVCCELGNDEGGGTRKDPLKAIQWYKRAATLGDTPAMYKMGMIQLKGLLGQPKNPREAVGWLKRAAERADVENPHALHELGLLYEQPQGPDGSIVRDEQYSFALFKQAADLGYKFSQFRLGCAYEYGLFNCPIDPRQSIMWYSRAAVQEEHQAELALSGWYLTGSEGVLQQSDTEAYLWARKAAMAGNAKAEYAMGYFTEVGIGIPANLEDAKRWYWRAAAQNFPKARERLEDLKKGGKNAAFRGRERISRSKVGKQNEGECSVM